jgi:hypothetical protein
VTRVLLLALASAAGVVASAAPIPEEEARRLAVARTFGVWTDPSGGNSFQADGPLLRLRLPGASHRAGLPVPSARLVPRFVRRIEGDFTAVVRVSSPALADGAADGRVLAGGLLATDAAGTQALVWRGEVTFGGTRYPFGTYWAGAKGGGGMHWGQPEPTGRAWLRLTRTGASLTFGSGWDGKEVGDGAPQRVDWVGPIDIGIFAENTTGVRAEVVFDRYSLTQPKK